MSQTEASETMLTVLLFRTQLDSYPSLGEWISLGKITHTKKTQIKIQVCLKLCYIKSGYLPSLVSRSWRIKTIDIPDMMGLRRRRCNLESWKLCLLSSPKIAELCPFKVVSPLRASILLSRDFHLTILASPTLLAGEFRSLFSPVSDVRWSLRDQRQYTTADAGPWFQNDAVHV